MYDNTQWLGVGVDYDLAGRVLKPAGAIARCGTATYAIRDGYAPEVWSLSRSLAPLWSQFLLDPTTALRVTGMVCTPEEGLQVGGVTEGRSPDGLPDGRVLELQIHVSPYGDGLPVSTVVGPWTGDFSAIPDQCIGNAADGSRR